MILVAIIGVLGGIVFANMAWHHYRDGTGEHRPWAITAAAFFAIGFLSGAALLMATPGLFSPQVKPAVVSKGKPVTEPTLEVTPPEAKTPPAPIETPVLSTWHSVASFAGSGSGTTRTFKVKGKSWRILWDIERNMPQTKFSFFVWRKGAKEPLSPDSLVPGAENETLVFEPGTFFIEVKASGVSWTMKVQDKYAEPKAQTQDAQ